MMTSADLPFVGEERRAHLRRLVEAYDEVVRAGESRLVVLTAPTGWGKTRIVRELYALLAEGAGGDYWPPRLEAGEGSWLQTRKRIFPAPFDVPERSIIPFLWLGVACQRDRMGRELAALQYAEAQFQAHVGPMAAALEGSGERWKTRLSALGAVAGLFGLPDPVQAAMTWHGIATAGWEMLTGEWRTVRDRRAGERPRRIDTHGEGGEPDRPVQLAEQIARLSGPDLPVVLVVDDAHWADPGTVAFVGALLGRPGHVLVVATAWPDRLAVQRTQAATFGHTLPGWIEAGHAELRELERLSDGELARMVADAAPRLLRALCERADGNPNRLRGLLSLRVVRRALEAGASITEEQIAALPAGDDEIVGAIWRELPEHVQEVLAVSTVQGAEFTPAWIPAAAEFLALTDVERGVADARSPWGWVRALDQALDAFLEAGLYERAERESRTLFLPDELDAARRAMLEWAAEQTRRPDWDTLSEAARRAVLEAHYAGAAESAFPVDAGVIDSTVRLLRHLEEGYDVDRWREVAERGLTWTEDRPEHADAYWTFRRKLADLVGEKGDVQGALIRYRALIREHLRDADATDDAHLDLRFGFAWWLIVHGDYQEAEGELAQIVRIRTQRFGPEHEATLRARRRRAIALLEGGWRRGDEAFAELDAVAEILRATAPPDDPELLNVRMCRADALGHTWLTRRKEAIAELEEVLELETRRVGRDHPATQNVRNNLGYWLLSVGRLDEAHETLETLYLDRLRLHGPDHPGTLTTRGNLIAIRAYRGDEDGAVEAYRLLLDDQTRVLGPDDPRTLGTVSNIASTLEDMGRPAEALPWAERLLADRERVMGDLHPRTLWARLETAELLDETGHPDRAIPLLERLVTDLPEVQGWGHRWTLKAFVRLARLLREAGRVEEGRRLLDRLVERRAEASGPLDFDTLGARRARATWSVATAREAEDAGALREAVGVLEALLVDHEAAGIVKHLTAEVEELLERARDALGASA